MHFRIEQRFPAPMQEVQEALVDPAFLERLGQLPKLGRPELLGQEAHGDELRQWVRYRFTGEVSGAVRRVVDPARLTWVEELTLDRRTGRTVWRIRPDHYANLLRGEGTFELRPDGERGTLRIAEAEIKVSVPLVGGRVESAIVSGLREHAQLEEQVLAAWLTSRQDPGPPVS